MIPFTINETIRMKPLKQDLTWTKASRLIELGLGLEMRHSLNFRTPFALSPKSGSVKCSAKDNHPLIVSTEDGPLSVAAP